jgi:uncharacterized HAD superfamily protein
MTDDTTHRGTEPAPTEPAPTKPAPTESERTSERHAETGRRHAEQAQRSEERTHPVRGRLVFGIDIDGTLSQAPEHFRSLIHAIKNSGERVVIITARDEGRRVETEALLRELHVHYDDLVMRPIDWPTTAAQFKVQKCLEYQVDLFIDNEEENCWAVEQQTPTLALFMLPIPEGTEGGQ